MIFSFFLVGCDSVGGKESDTFTLTALDAGDANAKEKKIQLNIYSFIFTGGTWSSMPGPWPKRLKAQWRVEGEEGWREQELDLPPKPLTRSGKVSQNPHLCLGFFADRIVVYVDGGSCNNAAYFESRPPHKEFEYQSRLALEKALADGVPPARIVAQPTEGFFEEEKPKRKQETVQITKEELPDIPKCTARDDCVKLGIAENAVFAETCGKVFPDYREGMQKAFSEWTALKLDIPGLEEILKPDNALRQKLRQRIEAYLTSAPKFEADIECSGRYQMMLSQEPKLISDAAGIREMMLLDYYRRRSP